MARRKPYSMGHLLFDFVMILITGGLWLIWIILREIRLNS